MTKAEKYIHYYNRLNGKTVSIETLKSFYDKVTSIVDRPEVNGYKADLESMKKRIVQGIFSAGTERVVKVECVPIDVTRKHTGQCVRQSPQGDKPKIKRVIVTKEVVKIKEVTPKNLIAEELPIAQIHTDTKRFQNRQDAFSEASAESVAKNFDPNKFDPIVVWKDPKSKKLFVLSGHSRLEGMKRRKAKAIAVRYFKGSEQEAIQFARSIQEKESDPIKGESYRRLREINETLASIQEKLKSRDAKVRVSTQAERDYLIKDLAPKLNAEKEKIQRDLDVLDKTQSNLFSGVKLNKLQKDQLKDSIRAGATPKINTGKKIKKGDTKKGWTDTPLFKDELESRQTSLFGFVTSDQTPQKTKGTFTLPGAIGAILGDLQRYKLEIVIAGETHSSKSELGKQIADAFIAHGDDVAWIDWEQGGLESKDTVDSIKRNVAPDHRKKFHVSGTVPKSLTAVKSLTKDFKVIALDSGSKLEEVTNAWIDELREEYPDTVWIIMFQQNTKGGTRGGTSAEFDAPVVLKTYRPDQRDFKKNYAHVFKNRGNKTGQYYLIASKEIVDEEPKKEDPKKMEAPKLDPIVEQQNPVVV